MGISCRCRQCGCRSFRADRSLAGRLVCARCGCPVGQGRAAFRQERFSSSRWVRRWGWWLVLILVVIGMVLFLNGF
ncbi:transcriptional regulator [Synechococcus sp. BS55D]|nr:transcriptional regulator [Synechococcus sp. BS55D]